MSLLEVQNLSKTFALKSGIFQRKVGSVRALAGVSLRVGQAEVAALVGGSGCGKSTLAKIIAGLLAPDEGELLWEGRPMAAMTRQERARLVQMVFQDPYASLNPKLSVGTQLSEVVRQAVIASEAKQSVKAQDDRLLRPRLRQGFGGLARRSVRVEAGPRNDVKTRCVELLQSVGLTEDALSHYPFQFSGGQRQRIAIARALAMQPSLLIADEPLSALDVTIQAQVLGLLQTLKATHGLTLLFITHDLAVVENFADRVIVLKDGQKVEEGPAGRVLRAPEHPYTRALLAAVPKIPC